MLQKTMLICAVILVYFSSCKKDVIPAASDNANLSQTDKIASLNALTPDTSRGWYGHYYGPDAYTLDTFPDSYFIHGGVAQMPNITDNEQIFSYINYDIPSDHPINGDSTTYEMDIKNPRDPYHLGQDVTMDVKGIGHVEGTFSKIALFDFVDAQQYSSYTQFYVGGTIHDGLRQLVHDFEDFSTVRLVLREHRASLFLNAKLLYSFPYKTSDEVGYIKLIEIGGKGYPACTRVKLYNSYTGKLILSENFNTDGQSTVIFH